MVEVIRQRPMSILHPYAVEVYMAVDGSEAYLSKPAKRFLRPERSREGGQARTGI
jgi:hypothetical protein